MSDLAWMKPANVQNNQIAQQSTGLPWMTIAEAIANAPPANKPSSMYTPKEKKANEVLNAKPITVENSGLLSQPVSTKQNQKTPDGKIYDKQTIYNNISPTLQELTKQNITNAAAVIPQALKPTQTPNAIQQTTQAGQVTPQPSNKDEYYVGSKNQYNGDKTLTQNQQDLIGLDMGVNSETGITKFKLPELQKFAKMPEAVKADAKLLTQYIDQINDPNLGDILSGIFDGWAKGLGVDTGMTSGEIKRQQAGQKQAAFNQQYQNDLAEQNRMALANAGEENRSIQDINQAAMQQAAMQYQGQLAQYNADTQRAYEQAIEAQRQKLETERQNNQIGAQYGLQANELQAQKQMKAQGENPALAGVNLVNQGLK